MSDQTWRDDLDNLLATAGEAQWVEEIDARLTALIESQQSRLDSALKDLADKRQPFSDALYHKQTKLDGLEAIRAALESSNEELRAKIDAAANVCEAYWNIAAQHMSEDDIRTKRDALLDIAAKNRNDLQSRLDAAAKIWREWDASPGHGSCGYYCAMFRRIFEPVVERQKPCKACGAAPGEECNTASTIEVPQDCINRKCDDGSPHRWNEHGWCDGCSRIRVPPE